MSPLKTLIPLDGSRTAEHALAFLPALRSFPDLEVRLVAVADHGGDFAALVGPEVVERERNVLSTYLREVAGDIHTHLGFAVETQTLDGEPARTLLDAVEAWPADLLVVSTHGRSGVARWRFGSVADKLVRAAACDTLVIGPRATGNEAWIETGLVPAFKQILVPLDGSTLAEQALPVATAYAERFGSRLHLVGVVSIPSASEAMAGEGYYGIDVLTQLQDGVKAYLAGVQAKTRATGGVTAEVMTGIPSSELERYVRDQACDLVVMTSHGRGGILRAALGSVADRLLGGAAPVLVVRPR